ncbi:hypothetical protein [Nonomuraea sp. 10N515B]|uniref:hypothetical protein n=1 Tax=Nonomuraea sp. 10N515B TaxID=3457422 RepID=UPI003FCD3F2E
MHDISHTSHEPQLQRALHEEVADVEPRNLLGQILDAAHRPAWWLMSFLATVGVLLILAGLLLLTWGQEQPAPAPSPASTHPWEA